MCLTYPKNWKLIGIDNLKVRAYLPEFHFGTQKHMLLPLDFFSINQKMMNKNFLRTSRHPMCGRQILH